MNLNFSCSSLIPHPSSLFVRRFVVEENDDDEPDGGGGGDEEEDDGEAGIAEQFETRLDAHQQRRADDHRGDDEADRDAVRHLLQTLHQLLLVNRVNLQLQFVIAYGIENL